MCDTLGRIQTKDKFAFFAKNSDRQVNEPQAIVYIPRQIHKEKKLSTTYIEIEQEEETNALLLSKPSWMWGGEMGVNEYGVCIGNEAVKTKGIYSKTGLIGMDLVRLGLERASTAKDAVDVIINLLEKYGQGGNCGYESEKYYDNSFLIMDRNELYILETKDKKWALKKQEYGSISNELTLNNPDKYSDTKKFKSTYSEESNIFNEARIRKFLTGKNILKVSKETDIFSILRTHNILTKPLKKGTLSSPCMHANSKLNCQTTSSMVVIYKEEPIIWFNGTSYPCLSIFKPYMFGRKIEKPIFNLNDDACYDYWKEQEKITRKLATLKLPLNYYKDIKQIENEIINNFNKNPKSTLFNLEEILNKEKEFYHKWLTKNIPLETRNSKDKKFWEYENNNLK